MPPRTMKTEKERPHKTIDRTSETEEERDYQRGLEVAYLYNMIHSQ